MRVFISYNNRDRAIAERFDAALRAALPDYHGYFAPRSNTGGAYWLPLLGEELGRSDGVLLLLGSSVGSWQELEYYEALRLNRAGRPRIVPVLLGEDSPGLHFLGQFHRLRLQRQPFEALVDELKAAFEGAGTAADAVPLWRDTNPYRGLQAMGSADAAFFFGREALTGDIISLLRTRRDRVLTLVGNSGVGKSSIIEAGVFAALRSRLWPGDLDRPWPPDLEDSRSWLFLTMRPGEHPLRALALAFVRCWLDDPADAEAQTLKWVGNFRNGSELGALVDATRHMIAARSDAAPPARILLHVDQGEELYLRAEADQKKRFSELIARAAGQDGLAVMASLRSDHYGRLQEDAALFPVCERVDVPPLGPDGIEAVIRKPVARLGARFESPEIVPLIVEATARESGALPLLSFMMTEAWQAMRRDEDSDGALRFPAGIIDVAGPLVRRAEQFLDLHPDDTDSLRRLFTLRLAHVPVTGEPVRRRASQQDCTPEEWALAQALATADWRLLTAGREGDVPWIEVAHEALLRKWPRLTGWIDAERAFLIWKGQLEADRRDWEAAPPDSRDEAVLMGLALSTAERWHRERKDDLSPPDAAFIERSLRLDADRRAAERERQVALAKAQAQAEWRRQWLMRGAVAAALVFLVLATIAGFQWSEAVRANKSLSAQFVLTEGERARADHANKELEAQLAVTRRAQELSEARLAETRREQVRVRASTAERLLQDNLPDAALAVAVAAFPASERDSWASLSASSGIEAALATAYDASFLRLILRGHEGPVTSAAFSPDGARIVTASHDGTARVWDAASGEALLTLTGHEGWVGSAAFSPDGARVVTASRDRTARIWDAATGAAIQALTGHEDGVLSAAFSPDGARVVTASYDKTARIWDAATGATIHVLSGHKEPVLSAAFSPDGARVVTASDDKTARIWDATSGAAIYVLSGHEDRVRSAALSPDGARVVTASEGTARIWEALTLPDLVDRARAKVEHARVLTVEEECRYFLRVEGCP